MGEGAFRYEATLEPDGRVQALVECGAPGASRPIPPGSAEGVHVLARGREILYRFDDERCLRDLAYPDVLEAMGQEVRLTLHKVGHGELLDEPELIPILRRLLADLEARAAAFRETLARLRPEA
jgi:hypothetical protein